MDYQPLTADDPSGDAPRPPTPPPPPTTQANPPSVPAVSGEQMRLVLDVSRMLAVPTELDPLLSRIAEAATVLLRCERASIFLHDPDTKELWTKVALGMGTKEIRVPCHKGIVGHAFTCNELVNIPDPYADPRFNPEPDRRSGFRTRSLLTAPMKDIDGRPLGVIQAVNKVDGPFQDNELALIQLLSEQAGVAIQRHKLQVAALEIVALKREMDLARKAQQALIPKAAPDVPGLEAVGWTMPASVTGGDCFDLWRMPDGRMGVFLADASGHGLGPALVVSQVRTLVRALSELEPDPHRLLIRVNARLAEDLETGQFVTAFLGFLGADGSLHWSSAGHGPSFLRRRCGEPIEVLDAPVQPLGVVPSWMDEPAPPAARVEPGGSLVLISDGIFEVTDPAGEQFGIRRMVGVLDGLDGRQCSAGEVMSAMRQAVGSWHGSAEPLDDQTIVVVEREEEKRTGEQVNR